MIGDNNNECHAFFVQQDERKGKYNAHSVSDGVDVFEIAYKYIPQGNTYCFIKTYSFEVIILLKTTNEK